jgi:cobalt-precorrin-5B (C1)-methyltransferase
MEEFIIREGKKLRLGYTTGSCAAAAAKAAACLLLTGRAPSTVGLTTPKGIHLDLSVLEPKREEKSASCAIEKDSGDDPDVTGGTLIFATVTYSEAPCIAIDGGTGVGRVTKPGLDQPVGAAAINSTPRRMIAEAVEEVCRTADYQGGLTVTISAPEGEALAKKTFNPRLGIVGGISILGTTGIVEPMSEAALVDTIRVELRQRRESGADYVLLTPGNYGSDFIRDSLGIDPERAVQASNFIGDAVDLCRELGFKGALLIGHIGKLTKIAGGMLNPHSRYGDCRMEILSAYAAACGADQKTVENMLECVACDEALRLLRETDAYDATLRRLTDRVALHLRHRAGEDLEIGAALFSKTYGLLGETDNARTLLKHITEEGN